MAQTVCPGSSALREPKPEEIPCPKCGEQVEIWSDEIRGECPKCGHVVIREGNVSCIEWCAMARECVGSEVFEGYMRNKGIVLRQRFIEELHAYFGSDTRRIRHAEEVLSFAERLLVREPGDWHIVIPAAILHDVGIKAAEEKYGSSAGHHQEREGPRIARDILTRAGLGRDQIDEICEIIAHHHSPGVLTTNNFKVLYDADSLVNIREVIGRKTGKERRRLIEETFLTGTGREMARQEYVR